MASLKGRLTSSLCIDAGMVVSAWLAAYLLRFNLFVPPLTYIKQALLLLPLVVVLQLGANQFFNVYRIVLQYISMRGVIRIGKAVFAATLLLIGVAYLLSTHYQAVPRSIFPIYAMLSLLLLVGYRAFYRRVRERKPRARGQKRVLLIGAGDAAEMIIRDLRRNNQEGLSIIGLVDDDPLKQGCDIHGVRVLGCINDLLSVVKAQNIGLILIAIPSANAAQMQRIVDLCDSVNIAYRTLPSINDLASGRAAISSLRDVRLEDLLSRDPIVVDWSELGKSVAAKKVLVTGGGGSIGSELCRQIIKLAPSQLIILDHSEFSLYKIHLELTEKFSNASIMPVLKSVTSKADVEALFANHKPDIVFHAAAYKHVPLLETHEQSAFLNNVMGTKIVAEAAMAHDVEKFVLISTDKAVHPTNVMGASKRCAEVLCYSLSLENRTEFITVRFGNVLGSAGSAIPLFKEQIKRGGPVTITHPEATRYFMTIPEACALILQSASIGSNGQLFVLDMGQPVKVSYLVNELIKLTKTAEADQIEVVDIGLRPGEKLHEELFYEEEKLSHVPNYKLRSTTLSLFNMGRFANDLATLLALPCDDQVSAQQVRETLFSIIDYTLRQENNNDELLTLTSNSGKLFPSSELPTKEGQVSF